MLVRNFRALLSNVCAFAFDVDGVCTNNQVLISERGELLRCSNTRDGYAIHTAVELGYPVAIITGGSTESVADRFRKLGVKDVYLACRDKVTALEEFCLVHGLKPEQVLYMGDDLPDYGVMQRVGVPTCPADASPEIRELAVYVSDRPGGDGCVRDVIEQVLRLHGKWTACPGALQ